MQVQRRLIKNLDGPLILLTVGLVAFGLVAAYSATFQSFADNPFYYVQRQLAGVMVGLIGSVLVLYFDYGLWQRWAPVFYGVSLCLLVVVLFVAPTIQGAGRWLLIGPVQVQPSELAKLAFIVALASFLSGHRHESPAFLFKRSVLYLVPPLILVLLQPDLGTALVFIGIFLGMLFIAGIRAKWLLGFIGVGAAGFGGAVLVSVLGWIPIFKRYQINRLFSFINPYGDPTGDGWNVIQSMIAIGSGGFFGKGLFAGSQTQLRFVPARHTDFIFAVIGEETGFLGGFLLLFGYGWLFLRGARMMADAKDGFGTLLIAGVLSYMFIHVVINVGMTLGMMPVTGLPLPFASVGGTSVAVSLMAVAMMLNVHMRRHKILF